MMSSCLVECSWYTNHTFLGVLCSDAREQAGRAVDVRQVAIAVKIMSVKYEGV
jgi:hypothetical protein